MHGLSMICIFVLYVVGVGIYTLLLIISGNGGSEEETWVDNALDDNFYLIEEAYIKISRGPEKKKRA